MDQTITMAEYNYHGKVLSTFFSHDHNISILLGIKNYLIWATKMRFFLSRLPDIGLINTDLS